MTVNSVPLLTPAEVSRIFKVETKTVTRWAQAGKLPPAIRTVGGHRRYRVSDIQATMRRLGYRRHEIEAATGHEDQEARA